ncbi:MAG: hypothetical protein IJG82_00915 [Atopobiaceae bacterium]|nr:hypothetical protein [Atopobiaceae bacterium]MBQ6522631.1 hypothetical protein [Atopobiaceae bacterium]MBQ9620324.1 hypothetical protein [Atopobiaceae bacterium]MCR4870714.1 hypothetical protein [Atopobiaceae bacterium]
MKKLLVSLMVLCALAGCSGGASAPSDSSGEVTDADVVEVTQEAVDTEAEEHVDEIDLTMMSPTMLFAEVVNMTRTPKKYDGATVTLRGGLMILAVDLETGVGSYSCYVEDATKCCQRGIGFTIDRPLEDTSILVEGSEVIIKGTFEIYEMGGRNFVRIADCDIWPA